jgi:hypothetical protein
MSDKSPHASMSKKSGVSIKQKRAAKKAEAGNDGSAGMGLNLTHTKKA